MKFNIFNYHGKIIKHLDRVCKYAYELKSQPTSVDISLTDRCNHKCPSCIGYKTGRKELPLEEWKRIAKDLKKNGVLSMKISGGGEPTLYKDYDEMIANTVGAGLEVGFYTNGTLLTRKATKNITRDCTWIRVSLDAAAVPRYMMIHGVGPEMWAKAIEGIKLLVKHKRKCTIGLAFLMASDLSWLFQAARLGFNLGVGYVHFRPFNNFPLTEKTLVKEMERQTFRYWEGKVRVLYSSCRLGSDFKRNYGYCHAKHFIPSIATDGTVYPCCHLRGIEKYKVGDLKLQSFKEIMWAMNGWYFDFENCVDYCRGDVINQLIERIRRPIPHGDFI